MDTEMEEVKRDIRKVEQQIDDVEGQLTKAATEADVAYWRKKEDRLRKKEEQLREMKLLLLKGDSSGHASPTNVELVKGLEQDVPKQFEEMRLQLASRFV